MPSTKKAPEPRQNRLMISALALLLAALALVLYKDRDFWFPDTQEADEQLTQGPLVTSSEPPKPLATNPSNKVTRRTTSHRSKQQAPPTQTDADSPPGATVTERTVLPPLEVEVVAGDAHQTIRPGSNSVKVDLQSSPRPQPPAPDASASAVTENAAQHMQVSPDTNAIVSRSVEPGYPVLARQMKVQGSVILKALIGRDGLIQNLQVVSGPPILAAAAREAVRQWCFKPHYEGADTVETQAKITVNFTISTN